MTPVMDEPSSSPTIPKVNAAVDFPSPPFPAIALLSGAALGYEVLLLRLFSIIQWNHFAYMIISLALLGYGMSGTFLALAGGRIRQWFPVLFSVNAVLFGLSAVACFFFAQRIPFNALELLWDPIQPLRLAALYLVLSVPFFFSANGIGLCFYHFRENPDRIYSADLLGGGVGAMAIVGLLFVLPPGKALFVLGALGFVAAALSYPFRAGTRLWSIGLLIAAVGGMFLLWLGLGTELHLSPYKGLSQALRVSGAVLKEQRSSPFGLLSVVESTRIPFRHAPGLSLNSPFEPPDQLGVFTDGGGMTVINRLAPDDRPPGYLDQLTSALPYHLLVRPRTLIVGAGGGSGVLQALYHYATKIDAVELNPQMKELVCRDYSAFIGNICARREVQFHVAEARAFVARESETHDLIQVALVDDFGPSSAGLQALNESYLYTVEAWEAFLDRLAPNGLLAITRWVKLPPRDGLKALATAIATLRKLGIRRPELRLAMIRSWKTSTLLVKKGEFTSEDIDRIRRFADSRSFDVAWFPGIRAAEANRFNVLERPFYFDGASALLGPEAGRFLARYKYDIRPPTDDRPYFFDFFRWRLVPELLAMRGRGGLGLLEWGFPVLAATLVQAGLISMVLIVVPLWIALRRRVGTEGVSKSRVLAYFLLLGLGFLFVEIAFIQKFILFLGHPLYAAAVVLATFLVFAGLGSRVSSKLEIGAGGGGRLCAYAVVGIAVMSIAYLLLLPTLFQWLAPLSIYAKGALSPFLVGPLAFFMGMPFPLGIKSLGNHAPDLIPWAWAINGCASVLSAVLATMIAVHFGFTAVILMAVGLYGVAAAVFPTGGGKSPAEIP